MTGGRRIGSNEDFEQDVRRIHDALCEGMIRMCREDRPIDRNLLSSIGEYAISLANSSEHNIRLNRAKYYNVLVKLGFTDTRIKRIKLFEGYNPPKQDTNQPSG